MAEGSLDPGPYRVSVTPNATQPETSIEVDRTGGGSLNNQIPQRYHLVSTSDLTIQVTSESHHYDVPLAGSGAIPASENKSRE